MSWRCHLFVITAFNWDPNIDSVWMHLQGYGTEDSFITSCVLGNLQGEVTGTCHMRVRPRCLGWAFAPVSRNAAMTHSFISDKHWMGTNWATAHRLVSFVLLVIVKRFFTGFHLIRSHWLTRTHLQTHWLLQNWCRALHEGQTVSCLIRAGLKCHVLHASKMEEMWQIHIGYID